LGDRHQDRADTQNDSQHYHDDRGTVGFLNDFLNQTESNDYSYYPEYTHERSVGQIDFISCEEEEGAGSTPEHGQVLGSGACYSGRDSKFEETGVESYTAAEAHRSNEPTTD